LGRQVLGLRSRANGTQCSLTPSKRRAAADGGLPWSGGMAKLISSQAASSEKEGGELGYGGGRGGGGENTPGTAPPRAAAVVEDGGINGKRQSPRDHRQAGEMPVQNAGQSEVAARALQETVPHGSKRRRQSDQTDTRTTNRTIYLGRALMGRIMDWSPALSEK